MLTNKQEIAFFSVLGIIFLIFLSIGYFYGNKPTENNSLETPSNNPFDEISLTAKSAFVYDIVNNKVLYEKNADERLPLASVTKVMSALIASEIAYEHSTVVVGTEALLAEGDSGLYGGERWFLKDLLDFSLINSSNDGMRAIALAFGALESSSTSSELVMRDFVERMNRKASELGLKNTYYWNDTGLDESEEKGGAYSSARDQSLLLEYILREKPTLLAATREESATFTSLDGYVHIALNTNPVTGNIPGMIASKTGYTDLAGGNLVTAFDPEIGRPIVITVLGSTLEGRFTDTLTLVEAALSYVQENVVIE